MIRKSSWFRAGLTAAIVIATPALSAAKVIADTGTWNSYSHGSTSARVEVHDSNVAPVLAVLVGGLVIASAIHASQHCDQVVIAAPSCPPPCPPVYRDCDDRGRWHRDNGWHGGRGRSWNDGGRGRNDDRGRGNGNGRGRGRGGDRHDG